jgi:hypothetical protein
MLNKIECKEGYVFALKDKSEVYDTVIYLGKYDSADNYIEVTKEEAKQIEKQIEEAYRREYEASLNKD